VLRFVLDTVVLVLGTHQRSAKVALLSCKALIRLSRKTTAGQRCYRRRCACTHHRHLTEAQQYSRNLCGRGGCTRKYRCSDRFAAVHYKTARVIVSAMNNHSDHAGMAKAGCEALTSLTSSDEDGEYPDIAEADAPAAVVATIRNHIGDLDICTRGCNALYNFSYCSSGAVQQAIVDAGAPAAIVDAMHAHEEDDVLSATCCKLLRRLIKVFAESVRSRRRCRCTCSYCGSVGIAPQRCTCLPGCSPSTRNDCSLACW